MISFTSATPLYRWSHFWTSEDLPQPSSRQLIFGILFCLKTENKKLKIEQSFYTSKVFLNTFKPLHNGHLGDRRKWLLLRSFITWATHSWELVDTISQYSVDISAHLPPSIPLAFDWSFALCSLWKQPYFLAPCCCMAMFREEELLRLRRMMM